MSCKIPEPDGPTTENPDAPPQQQDAPSLEEIADAIDPGPRAALTVELPEWLAVPLRLSTIPGDPQASLAEARAEWKHWTDPSQSGGGDAAQLEKVLRLARALALAERAAGNVEDAPVEALLVLERVY